MTPARPPAFSPEFRRALEAVLETTKEVTDAETRLLGALRAGNAPAFVDAFLGALALWEQRSAVLRRTARTVAELETLGTLSESFTALFHVMNQGLRKVMAARGVGVRTPSASAEIASAPEPSEGPRTLVAARRKQAAVEMQIAAEST
jgi:hypothetical protein